MSENWFDRPIDRLLAEYTQRRDSAYVGLVRRLEAAGALAQPDFALIWSCFAAWFSDPIEGVAPGHDVYEFGLGFIDGDPERADLELEAPASLGPPLVELSLVRNLVIDDPEEAAASLGVGSIGAVFHYRLTDAWYTLRDTEAATWINSNPYGWTSFGDRVTPSASLAGTASTEAFRLASDAPPLRAELFSSSRDSRIVLGG